METTDRSKPDFQTLLMQLWQFCEWLLLRAEDFLRVPLHQVGVPPQLERLCVIIGAVLVLAVVVKLLVGLLRLALMAGVALLIGHVLWTMVR